MKTNESDDRDIAMNNYIKNLTYPDNQPPSEPKETFWETDIELIESCGNTPKSVDVTVMPIVIAKIDALMNKYNRMEWLAYLVGNKNNNVITDIIIPKQTVTPVNVFVKEHVSIPIIGVIHSHHDMGNNFSHTDDEYINSNHDISLCVSKSGIQGQVRLKTECNKYVLTDANVIHWNGGCNIDEFIKDADELITIKYKSNKSNEDSSFTFIPENKKMVIEGKNVIRYINDYYEYIKDIETSNGIDDETLSELIFLIALLKSINTQKFYIIEDTLYDNKTSMAVSNQLIDLVDELDVFHDDLSSIDLVEIKKLLDYITDLSELGIS